MEPDRLVKTIYDYMVLNQKPGKSDAIIVLGSHDMRVADRGIDLFKEGYAPLIIFSGSGGKVTKDWNGTEAERFAGQARAAGVPEASMLLETESTNTGDNLLFVRKLLKVKNIRLKKAIIVHKPYLERRTYATVRKVWPELEIVVTSPQLDIETYLNEAPISMEESINIIVGDLQRLREYSKSGFQIEQEIPPEVWGAYKQLVRLGYDKHLIRG